ncbi:MAG: nickel pincer cofactor biosynthesis protein LarB [Candidatus Nanopelagicales bacterium]
MDLPAVDLGYAKVDTHRAHRTGDPEVVFAQGKTPEQTLGIMRALHEAHPDRAVLATRVDAATAEVLAASLPVDLDPLGRTAVLGSPLAPSGQVLVICAGTSDLPVAHEAVTTARVYGTSAELITDVGVAGLHRLLAVHERLDQADALVVVAGMEGALPSVVGGLTGVAIVAVPTSVGYGASFNGLAALLAMLNSCAPGVAVVNIDNGFGAAVHAARIARNAR